MSKVFVCTQDSHAKIKLFKWLNSTKINVANCFIRNKSIILLQVIYLYAFFFQINGNGITGNAWAALNSQNEKL